jgi:hypothetical protein
VLPDGVLVTKTLARLAIAICVTLLAPREARADSDGYFCVGRDYLAYQFGLAAPPVTPHWLYVVRLTQGGLSADTVRIALPQFQVRGMRCDAAMVTVFAYDAEYRVTLDDSHRPVSVTKGPISSAVPRPPAALGNGNLARLGYSFSFRDWGKTIRRPLGQQPGGNQFVLEFVPDPMKAEECQTQVTTHILLLDPSGAVIAKRQVFRGIALRACGGDTNGATGGAQRASRTLTAA